MSEINLSELNSELYNNIVLIDDSTDVSLINTFDSILEDFNSRNINPKNINFILSFCDYLLLEDTLNFLILNSVPTTTSYILTNEHNVNYTLPPFMTGNITCEEISKYNLINWLKYAHKNGYKWNEWTCTNASNGHLNCLKYAHENGCVLNIKSFVNITGIGNFINISSDKILIKINDRKCAKYIKQLLDNK